MAMNDPRVVEHAERAMRQLTSHIDDLHKKHVRLLSRIKSDETELEEVEALLSFMQAAQDKTEAEKKFKANQEKQFGFLEVDAKVEEKALIVKAKSAADSSSHMSIKTLNTFALAEKEGIRGYASGPGTTCSRAEARAREQRMKLLRIQRQLQTR